MSENKEIIFEVQDNGMVVDPAINPKPVLPNKEEATTKTILGPDFLTKINGNSEVGQQPEGQFKKY